MQRAVWKCYQDWLSCIPAQTTLVNSDTQENIFLFIHSLHKKIILYKKTKCSMLHSHPLLTTLTHSPIVFWIFSHNVDACFWMEISTWLDVRAGFSGYHPTPTWLTGHGCHVTRHRDMAYSQARRGGLGSSIMICITSTKQHHSLTLSDSWTIEKLKLFPAVTVHHDHTD